MIRSAAIECLSNAVGDRLGLAVGARRRGNPMKLTIRHGKSGRVSSPTTTAGYVAQLALVLLFLVVLVLAARHPKNPAAWWFALLILVAFSGVALRDTLAWFRASPEERQAFVGQIKEIRAEQSGRRAASTTPASSRWFTLGATVFVMLPFVMMVVVAPSMWPLLALPGAGIAYVAVRLRAEAKKPQA